MNDLIVVLRTNDERTVDLCKRLLLKQIPEEKTFCIKEKPFFNAVVTTFSIAAEEDTMFLLALDADVLVFEGAIEYIIQVGQRQMSDKVFRIDFPILDKFRGRTCAGAHLYNHRYTNQFLKRLKGDSRAPERLREESDNVVKFCKKKDLDYYRVEPAHSIGMHDYHQYFSDIVHKYKTRYKRCLVDKNLEAIIQNIQHEINKYPKDLDYRIALDALLGCRAGCAPSPSQLFEKYDVEEKKRLTDREMRDIVESMTSSLHEKESDLFSMNSTKMFPGVAG